MTLLRRLVCALLGHTFADTPNPWRPDDGWRMTTLDQSCERCRAPFLTMVEVSGRSGREYQCVTTSIVRRRPA